MVTSNPNLFCVQLPICSTSFRLSHLLFLLVHWPSIVWSRLPVVDQVLGSDITNDIIEEVSPPITYKFQGVSESHHDVFE